MQTGFILSPGGVSGQDPPKGGRGTPPPAGGLTTGVKKIGGLGEKMALEMEYRISLVNGQKNIWPPKIW